MFDLQLPGNTDLMLRPLLVDHLGNDERFVGTSYHNTIVAIRYCVLLERGPASFKFADQRQDVEALREAISLLSRASRIWNQLSSETHRRIDELEHQDSRERISSNLTLLDWSTVADGQEQLIADADIQIDLGTSAETVRRRLNRRTLQPHNYLDAAMERQSIEEDDLVRAIQLGRSPSQFWKQINYAEKALSEITGSPISKKRVDWRACGIAWYSTDIWLHRTGAVAPSTVHADAPGPFGRFLQDVLDLLYTASHLTPPSARSAMRALSNITKDGAEFALNW